MENFKNNMATHIAFLYCKYMDLTPDEFDFMECSYQILSNPIYRIVLINTLYTDIKQLADRKYIKKADSVKINEALEILHLLNNTF